jgi:hypothetical protein
MLLNVHVHYGRSQTSHSVLHLPFVTSCKRVVNNVELQLIYPTWTKQHRIKLFSIISNCFYSGTIIKSCLHVFTLCDVHSVKICQTNLSHNTLISHTQTSQILQKRYGGHALLCCKIIFRRIGALCLCQCFRSFPVISPVSSMAVTYPELGI